MSRSKKTDLEKLTATWYAKLKKAGFEDAERNELDLKISSSRFFIRHKYTKELWESKEEYYRLAEHFLNEHPFDSELERVIWEYHVNAISSSNIVDILHKSKVTQLKSTAVKNIIRKLSGAMKRKYGVTKVEPGGH